MKKLLLILLSFLIFYFHSNLLAQSEEELVVGELIIFFENRPSSWEITIKIEAQGAVWDHNHNLTNEYLGGNASYSQNSLLYRHSSGLSWGNYYMEPVLSLGLYEISIWEENNKKAWFYLDYRTAHLPFATTLQVPDILLNYDVINNTLDLFDPEIGYVLNGTYFPFWELKESCNHVTTGLEDYWENALSLIPSIGNHPQIHWGPYDLIYAQEYRVYRAVTNDTNPPQIPVFTCIDTISESTFLYVDENFLLGGPNLLHYHIKAAYEPFSEEPGLIESQPSNDVVTSGGLFKESIHNKKITNYLLDQNYPNPFNPSTNITYQLAESDFVTLKVYDILGREVAILVNEQKEAGTHSIEFEASGLSSGIYFYKIQTDNYFDTRKLILQK